MVMTRARVVGGMSSLALMGALGACQFPSYTDEQVASFYGGRQVHNGQNGESLTSKKEVPIKTVEKPGEMPKGKSEEKPILRPVLAEPGMGKERPRQAGFPRPPHNWPSSPDHDPDFDPDHDPDQDQHQHQGHGHDHDHDQFPSFPGGPMDPDSRTEVVHRGSRPGHEVSRPALGEACSNDPSRGEICLGLKYVAYVSPSGEPVVSDRDAVDNIREVNLLWRECGIQFQIDRYVPVTPESIGLSYWTANYGELNEIRQTFVNDATLLVVMTGTWDRRGTLGTSWANAWTNLPGEGIYGSILERTVSHEPNILAHELGHYLSLDHVSDSSSLMNPVIYKNSTHLSAQQCESARWAAKYFWKKMIRRKQTEQSTSSVVP